MDAPETEPKPVDSASASPDAHEPPPAPEVRSISPAPEDFENPPATRNLLWPVVWCAIAATLILCLHSTIALQG